MSTLIFYILNCLKSYKGTQNYDEHQKFRLLLIENQLSKPTLNHPNDTKVLKNIVTVIIF